jgi:hypothetical protein
MSLLRQVLELLQRDHRQVKLSKCVFAQRQLKYLGHVISECGVATDPKKVTAVSQWPVPTTVTDLRSFFGTHRLLPSLCKALRNHH